MKQILREPIQYYLLAKKTAFRGNTLANRLRNTFPEEVLKIVKDKNRYKIIGSAGKGNWTECPWIAILDVLITRTPQSGFYPVFLFASDMSGVYLSLNQGVTEVKENYKKETKHVLRLRAENYRSKFDYDNKLLSIIDLKSSLINARLYEAGNIIAKYYPAKQLPEDDELKSDILRFLNYYDQIILNDTQFEIQDDLMAIERKKLRLHYRIERNASIPEKVKRAKGFRCEACNFEYKNKYGSIGEKFIEVHHLTPISELDLEKFVVNLIDDFAVLCANCHRMIHKFEDPSNLEGLRALVKKQANRIL